MPGMIRRMKQVVVFNQCRSSFCTSCARKKLFWDAASLKEGIKHSRSYAFPDQDVSQFDWALFRRKSDAFVGKVNKAYETILMDDGIHYVQGNARLVDWNSATVQTDKGTSTLFSAKNVLLATGSTPLIPSVSGAELGITSDGFFALQEQPRQAAVIGEGYVAAELAGLLHALGTETHLFVRRETFLHRFDPMIQEFLLAEYTQKGIRIHRNSSMLNIEKLDGIKKRIWYNTDDKNVTLDVDCILWAIGRQPQTQKLGLDKVGVHQNPNGWIVVDSECNTTVSGIYAIGDVCDKGPHLTPVAVAMGTKLSEKLFGTTKSAGRLLYNHIPSVLFSHPPIGTVGLTEPEARKKFGGQNVRTVSYRTVTTFYWAMMEQEDHSSMIYKIVCEGHAKTVVGLHIIGRRADEMLQGFAVAINKGITLAELDEIVNVHPTAAEELLTLGKVGDGRTIEVE